MKKILQLIPVLLICVLATGIAAVARDVTVSAIDRTGRRVHAIVDSRDLNKAKAAIEAGKPLDDLRKKRTDPAGGDQEPPEGAIKLTFAVEDETTEGFTYEPEKVYVTRGDGTAGRDYYYAYKPDPQWDPDGEWACYVNEPGIYDITLTGGMRFDPKPGEEWGEYLWYYVVKEQVKIDEDQTITFRQSDAKNKLSCRTTDNSGNFFPEHSEEYCNEGAYRFINCSDASNCFNMVMYGSQYDRVYVSDLSDRWTYVYSSSVCNKDGAYATLVKKRGPFTESAEFTNDPKDYQKKSIRFDSTVPVTDVKGVGMSTFITWKGIDWDAGSAAFQPDFFSIGDEVPLYVNAKASDLSPEVGYDLMFNASVPTDKYIMDYFEDGTPMYEYNRAYAPTSWIDDKGDIRCTLEYGFNFGYGSEGDKIRVMLPLQSVFDYRFDNMSCCSLPPLCRKFLSVYEDNWSFENDTRNMVLAGIMPFYPSQAQRNLPCVIKVLRDGELITDWSDNFDLGEWCATEKREKGVFDIEMKTTYNDKGEKPLHSSVAMHFDTRNEVIDMPEISIYQVRGADGSLSDKADKDSRLIFSMNNFDFPVKVTAIAADGTEFPIEAERKSHEVSALDSFFATEEYYEASFAGFTGSTGAYDLRFESEGGAGERCVQTIERAFSFSDGSGIDRVESDALAVSVSGRDIVAPEGAVICNAAGLRCGSRDLAPGVYIVRLGARTAKVVIR